MAGGKRAAGKTAAEVQAELFRPAAEKMAAARPDGRLPATLAETLALAETCLAGFLVFQPRLKEDISALKEPDRPEAIALVWRMLLALARVLRPCLAGLPETPFSRDAFIMETGLLMAPPWPEAEPEAGRLLFDLKHRNTALRFSLDGDRITVLGLS